jgi:hypothetical protein
MYKRATPNFFVVSSIRNDRFGTTAVIGRIAYKLHLSIIMPPRKSDRAHPNKPFGGKLNPDRIGKLAIRFRKEEPMMLHCVAHGRRH